MHNRKSIQLLITIAMTVLLIGCATYSQMFINASGDIQRCGSYGSGMMGMATAEGIYLDCIADMKAAGYIEIERAGSIGVYLSADSTVFILKVQPGSPAELSGLLAGDKILSIDGVKVHKDSDAKILLFGSINTPVKMIVNREGIQREYEIIRASYTSVFGNPK